MPKKPKLTEPEVRARIVKDTRIRIGCEDFEPEFTLRPADGDPAVYPRANWTVASTPNADTWPSDCTQAFKEAVARARRTSGTAAGPAGATGTPRMASLPWVRLSD